MMISKVNLLPSYEQSTGILCRMFADNTAVNDKINKCSCLQVKVLVAMLQGLHIIADSNEIGEAIKVLMLEHSFPIDVFHAQQDTVRPPIYEITHCNIEQLKHAPESVFNRYFELTR